MSARVSGVLFDNTGAAFVIHFWPSGRDAVARALAVARGLIVLARARMAAGQAVASNSARFAITADSPSKKASTQSS